MMVLVDTTIWSLAFRRSHASLSADQKNQVIALQHLVEHGTARILGSIRQELLSGIRLSQQFVRLRNELRFFPDVPVETEDYEAAAAIGNTCRGHGVTGSPVDYLLCAVARRRGWAIFTSDIDFHHYAKHVPLALFRAQI